MEEMYGFHPGGSDHYSNYNNYLFYPVDTDDDGSGGGGGDYYRFPGFAGFHDGRVPIVVGGHHQDPEVPSAVSDAASAAVTAVGDRREEDISGGIRARIAAHPLYPKLLQAYIDCRKVGAPPDIAGLLEDMEHENDVSGRLAVSSCIGADPELDEFMEAYYHLLAKYKLDLSRPFDEATTFLNHIETQLSSLCSNAATATSSHISDEAAGSDDDFSVGNIELQECSSRTSDDRALKDKLLRKYSGYISSLKLEFSKKKKKGKLPKEARQTLLDWWNTHYKWPYPTEADKVVLAKVTGLDQKQINNWFINQRKRHWKPSENMQYAVMDSSTLFANYNSN